MGYDISDYEDIHAAYGTLQDCNHLIKEIHDRGMRVIFDLVINHTSDQHEWFKESRSSKTNPKRDWYIWRPARIDENGNRCRPNSWRSNFSIPAWTWDETTQEYYLHLFASEQPDLNWENEQCRNAIYDSSIKFWLERGVDGFRVDTVNLYSKTYKYNTETKIWDLPDAPVTAPHIMYCNGPRMREWLHEMNDIFDNYDVMSVGELPYTPNVDDVLRYISAKERQLNMVFNFETVNLGQTPGARFKMVPFQPADFKREISRWQNIMETTDAWTAIFLENHDQGRSISRFGSDLPEHREQSGKALAMTLATMTGTLFLYQGQEIGMINAPRAWPVEEYKDIKSIKYIASVKNLSKNDHKALGEALDGLQRMARDHARVPMQWDSTTNAGFCDAVKPWMRIIDNYKEINVAEQLGRKDSSLEFWRMILAARKEHKDLFVYGKFRMIEQGDGLIVFTKESNTRKSLTVVNLTDTLQEWSMPSELAGLNMKLLLFNSGSERDKLMPYEGRVYIN